MDCCRCCRRRRRRAGGTSTPFAAGLGAVVSIVALILLLFEPNNRHVSAFWIHQPSLSSSAVQSRRRIQNNACHLRRSTSGVTFLLPTTTSSWSRSSQSNIFPNTGGGGCRGRRRRLGRFDDNDENENILGKKATTVVSSSSLLFAQRSGQLDNGRRHREHGCRLDRDNDGDDDVSYNSQARRRLLLNVCYGSASSLGLLCWTARSSKPAHARGLVQFPLSTEQPLMNRYHLLRAGSSIYEEEQGMWSTNPLFLTNREDALTAAGQEQIRAAALQLQASADDASPTLVKYSLAARCMDTANVVGQVLQIGRDRLIPEFTFLDPRAVGAWDLSLSAETESAVWAYDVNEAGEDGKGARPPPTDDGTPHETLADQGIRLRQLLSVLEGQYSGETILLVFPDGTGPALLCCMMAGIPLNRVHELEFAPGELRADVTPQSILSLWKTKQEPVNREAYLARIEKGRAQLRELREKQQNDDMTAIAPDRTSAMDEKVERERIETERAYRRAEEERKLQQERQERERLERQRELQEQQRLRREEQRKQRAEMAAAANKAKLNDQVVEPDASSVAVMRAGGVLALGGAAAIGLAAGGGDDEQRSTAAAPERNATATSSFAATTKTSSPPPPDMANATTTSTSSGRSSLYGTSPPPPPRYTDLVSPIEQQVNGDTNSSFLSSSTATVEAPPPPPVVDPYEAAERAMQDYLDQDDGAEAWLQSMSEIIAQSTNEDNNQNEHTKEDDHDDHNQHNGHDDNNNNKSF